MLQGTADHARHGSNRFEHNRSMAIPTSEERVSEEPQCLREGKCNAIGKIHRSVVSLELRGISHRDGQSRSLLPEASRQVRDAKSSRSWRSNCSPANLPAYCLLSPPSIARSLRSQSVLSHASRRSCNPPHHRPEATGHSLPSTSKMMIMSTTTPIAPLGQ